MLRGLPLIKHIDKLRLPFPKTAKYRASDLLELVHGDLCGPITLETHGGRRYFLLLVYDCRRYMWLQSSKDKAAAAIKNFQAWVEESGKRLHVLTMGRGGEFTSLEFGKYCADRGVLGHLSAPYSLRQNIVVEWRNQNVINMAWSMMKAKMMSTEF